jgi:hypothetical protein
VILVEAKRLPEKHGIDPRPLPDGEGSVGSRNETFTVPKTAIVSEGNRVPNQEPLMADT